MPLPWVRLDTQFPQNPKILGLVEDKNWRSAFNYVAGLCYSGAHGTDGFIPNLALIGSLHGTKKEAGILVESGLWLPVPGGFEVNDWAEFQGTSEEAARRKDKARWAAQVRWEKERQAKESRPSSARQQGR